MKKKKQHEKLTEGVIAQKIKLVAETDNLDNETEIVFKLFEKEKLLVEKDTKENHYDHLHLQGYDRKFIKNK